MNSRLNTVVTIFKNIQFVQLLIFGKFDFFRPFHPLFIGGLTDMMEVSQIVMK